MRDRDVKPGDPISKFTAEAYRAIVAELESWEAVKGAWPIIIDGGAFGKRVRIDHTQGFYATLSGSTSPYSFVERFGTTGGTWTAGQRTGTTNAYEVNSVASLNGKTVWIEPGFPGDYRFQYIGSAGGGCATATVNADARCCGSGSALSGFTFDLRDSADTTTLATQTGSSASFTGQDGTLSYKVRVSKAGYHTKTSGTLTPGCGGTVSTSVSTWPTTYSLSNHVQLDGLGGPCGLSGATVAYTGDGSDSDTTDASGNATSSLSSSSTACTQTLNYTITPPSGHGAAVKTGTISVNPCAPGTQTYTLDPSTGHVGVICNARYMPEDLDWVDDFGACTLSHGGGGTWGGSFTYTSNHCMDLYECFPPFLNPYTDQTGDVTVDVYFICSPSSCSSSNFTIHRGMWAAEGVACGGSTTLCQPVADAATGEPSVQALMVRVGEFSCGGTVSASCGTSISLTFTTEVEAPTGCAEYEETAVTVDVTGTIT